MLLLYTFNISVEDLTWYTSSFKQKTSNEHHLIHDVDHPCPNHVYSKTYKQQSNLQGGRKAYTCDVCNKSFTQPSHLRLNQCTWSGQYAFTCGVSNHSRNRRTINTHIVEGVYLPVKSNKLNPHVNGRSPLSVMTVHQWTHSRKHPFTWGMYNYSCSR